MNRDVLIEMALELDNKDLLTLCLSGKDFNKNICKNDLFWQKKVTKEFPKYLVPPGLQSYKELYRYLSKPKYFDVTLVINGLYNEDEGEDLDANSVTIQKRLKFNNYNFNNIAGKAIHNSIWRFVRANVNGTWTVEIDDKNTILEEGRERYFDSRDIKYLRGDNKSLTVYIDTQEEIYSEDDSATFTESFEKILDEEMNELQN